MDNQATARNLTLWELLTEYIIEIPIIQRDYAQGREKEKNKAEKFLEAIKNGCNSKLNLDFVYGKRDKENKIFIANFYKYGFVGVMLDWIDSGMDEDYQMILDDLEMTVLGIIDLSIQNFTNKKK